MRADDSAITWARELPAGARTPWAELEARAFRGRRRVLAELDGAGAFQRRADRARSPWFTVGLVLTVLPALAVALLPVFAFAALGGNDFGLVFTDSAVAISVAGWLLAASAAWQAVTLVRGLLGAGIGESEFSGWAAVVVGVVATVMIGARGTADAVANWPVWAAVALLAAALGIAVVALARRRRRTTDRPGVRGAGATVPLPDSDATSRLVAAVAAIPAEDRDRIRAELAEAVAVLRRRGIVTPAEAARALDADLGFLSQRMSS